MPRDSRYSTPERAEAERARQREKRRRWRAKNRDLDLSSKREYRLANPSRVVAWKAKWREANPDAARAQALWWRQQNPGKVRLIKANRDARIRAGRLSMGLTQSLMRSQRGKCAACAAGLGSYHLDHVLPIALGGLHEDRNIQLLCPPCNLSKGARHPVDFMRTKGLLL